MDNSNLQQRYYSRLIALERRSPLTAETYGLEIRGFLGWLGKEGLDAASADTPSLVRYLEYRRTVDGIDPRSTAKAISALRSFFRFLTDERVREDNPAALLEKPRRPFRLPETLPREAVEEILASVDTKNPRGIRDRTIYELLYSAGLRISEAVSLNLGDLDLASFTARARGKGNKERLVVFGAVAADWLGRYLAEARPLLAKSRKGPALFITGRGRRLSRKGIWKNYRRLTLSLGTGSRLHSLRHSFATEMLAGGADLRSLQELLGHSDITTTQIYTHVDSALLRESHRRFLPKLGGWGDK
ncbi:MAG: tyrosine-type recombinase/integrase [Treponema sp.]|nr:tyrosine-type recombinase/integrase [Treponema sp.]